MFMKRLLSVALLSWATCGFASAELNVLRTWQASVADHDGNAQFAGGHAFWFANALVPGGGRQYIFANDSGRLLEVDSNGDGQCDELRLTGRIASKTSAAHAFDVTVVFAPTAPGVESPKKELRDMAYVENGGSIDTSSWSYFSIDQTRTSLVGVGSATLGQSFSLFTRPTDGSIPFQLGMGANGKNTNMGLSGWFGFDMDNRTYAGDINIDLSVIPVPGAVALGMLGLAALGGRRFRGA
jgi:hypothetical protein